MDENDNRPLFTSSLSSDIHAYDNWPADIMLAQFEAKDKDYGDNAKILYSLTPNQKIIEDCKCYFHSLKLQIFNFMWQFFQIILDLTINNETGQISTVKPLTSLADKKPYVLTIVATDRGTPSFSSSTQVLMHIHEAMSSSDFDDKLLRFIKPSVEFVLQVPEVILY